MKISSGIDPASSGTKQVTLEASWKQIKATSKETSNIIVATPSGKLTFRKLSLPFGDKKKCEEMVREELEYSLAFDLKKAAWDFTVNPQGEAYAYAAKNKIEDEDKKILDCEITSLARTCLWCGFSNALILDIGASKTAAVGLKNGYVNFISVILTGGRHIDEKIAEEYGVSIDEAINLKEKEGLDNLIFKNEIVKLFKTLKTRINSGSEFCYDTIITSGGCSQAKKIGELAEQIFKCKALPFALPDNISPYTHAVAFGAAIRDKYPHLAVNFGHEEKDKDQIPYFYIAAALIPLILAVVYANIQSAYYKAQVANYSNLISTEIKKEFPNKKILKPVQQLEQEIKERKRNSSKNDLQILEILQALQKASLNISRPNSLTVYDVEISKSTANISGEIDSILDAEKIRETLSEHFRNVKLTEGKTLQSKKVKFTLRIDTAKPLRQSSGGQNDKP